MSGASLLEVRGIGKTYPGVQALSDVSLSLDEGEVLAVLGENGAGKSTLMKILAGLVAPDEGEISLEGHVVEIPTARRASELGIALIHQELVQCENLTVEGWIALGREPRRGPFLDRRAIRARAQGALDRLGAHVRPSEPIARLPVGQRQLVEIAKAIAVGARVLIMDEPTSALSEEEAEGLFRVVDDLRRKGVGVLYISHRLGEIARLADRAVVLRDGERVGELTKGELDHDRIVSMMVGRDVERFYHRVPHAPGPPVLVVEGLKTQRHPDTGVSLTLREGEIVGIAGLVGAGRTEVLEAIAGVNPRVEGELTIGTTRVPGGRVADAVAAGCALVPEDRKVEGLVLSASVTDNVVLPGLAGLSRWGFWRRPAAERATGEEMARRLELRPPDPSRIVGDLSGGNQQKAVLGKWLALDLRVLLLDEPTRGIDVGAKEEIYRLLDELTGSGLAVLFASSEIEEVLGLADRILVMHEGRLAGELARDDATDEKIMALATGKHA